VSLGASPWANVDWPLAEGGEHDYVNAFSSPTMDQYDDDESTRARVLSNGQVLAFIASYWVRRRGLLASTVALTLVALVFEILLPTASKRLVDAGDARSLQRTRRLVGLGGLRRRLSGLRGSFRNLAFRFWNPLAAHNMEEMTNEGFARVQAFSADWHGDTFGGATVRRLSRAMWATTRCRTPSSLWIAPALIVLLGLSLQMMAHWPLIGAFSLAMVAIYIVSNILFSNYYVRQANMRSWRWISRDRRSARRLDHLQSDGQGLRRRGARGGTDRDRHRTWRRRP